MQNRTSSLLAIRPNIDTIDKSLKTKDVEAFQNNVLRPILKFQNDLLLQIFIDYTNQYKGVFFKLSDHEKLSYIQQALSTNQRLRSLILGTIVGLFAVEDFGYYKLNSSALNKRIITMTIQRLQSQLDYLTYKI
ncbi:MAG TPA: glyoxalase [Flavobacteriales bacterium]|nr:glyoxalase [Flavobacteriales bacterium]|tara:strand:+ start:3093 stop:3494 length:402 start_codon:yes stop_codon:yes gene_type:complete